MTSGVLAASTGALPLGVRGREAPSDVFQDLQVEMFGLGFLFWAGHRCAVFLESLRDSLNPFCPATLRGCGGSKCQRAGRE